MKTGPLTRRNECLTLHLICLCTLTLLVSNGAGKNLLPDGKRIAGKALVWQEEEHATCCGGIRKRRNHEGKRNWKGVPLETGSQAEAGREAKEAKVEQTGATREAERSAGRLSLPIGEGDVGRSPPPRAPATGRSKDRRGWRRREANALGYGPGIGQP